MKWIIRILQALLAVLFLMSGFMKLNGTPTQVEAFTNIYGYGTGAMYAVGAIEIIAAVGLLLGFWKKKPVPIFSALLAVIMAGAAVTHLMAGQGFGAAMVPIILLILAIAVFTGHNRLAKTKKLKGKNLV